MPALEVEANFFTAQVQGCSSVIDIGCGLGFPALVVAPHMGYLIALDAAPTMVCRLHSYIQQLGYDTIGVVRGRATALPFGNKRFDGAILCGTLGSLAEPERMLEELYRVMQPAGIVACMAENFADKLVLDEGRAFRWFRMDEDRLSLQAIEYLQSPYRIRDYRYVIRSDSELYRELLAEHQGDLSWRIPTEQTPMDLPQETVAKILYDEAIQYDPTTLRIAFKRAGFREQRMEQRRHFRVEHIFASFERR